MRKLGVSKLCVWGSLCVDKLCVDKLCVSKLCVDKSFVDKLCVDKLCGRRQREERREEQARECPTKNKNPTQRCGEKTDTLILKCACCCPFVHRQKLNIMFSPASSINICPTSQNSLLGPGPSQKSLPQGL